MATFTVTLSASARKKVQNAKGNALYKLVHDCLTATSIVLPKKGVGVVPGSTREVVVCFNKRTAKSVNLDAMQLQLGDLGVVSLSSVQASSYIYIYMYVLCSYVYIYVDKSVGRRTGR